LGGREIIDGNDHCSTSPDLVRHTRAELENESETAAREPVFARGLLDSIDLLVNPRTAAREPVFARGSLDSIDLLVDPQTAAREPVFARDLLNSIGQDYSTPNESEKDGKDYNPNQQHFITQFLRSTSISPEPTNEQSFESFPYSPILSYSRAGWQ
jgi:hypothetical protein